MGKKKAKNKSPSKEEPSAAEKEKRMHHLIEQVTILSQFQLEYRPIPPCIADKNLSKMEMTPLTLRPSRGNTFLKPQ